MKLQEELRNTFRSRKKVLIKSSESKYPVDWNYRSTSVRLKTSFQTSKIGKTSQNKRF